MTADFRLLLDPPAAGAWNMAVDETLLEAAAANQQCTLRFYQWAEPTLSLGYFQAYADRNGHEASRHSAVVRRTSGGGAIMHDFDVTYSLAVPEHHPLAADRLGTYRVVHDALIDVLAELGIRASLYDCKRDDGRPVNGPDNRCRRPINQPGVNAGPKPPAAERAVNGPEVIDDQKIARQPFLCFQRRAAGDVLVNGEKIAGSAQRRCRGAVLQHGSVLLARSAVAPELNGLKELTTQTILVEEFIQAWLETLSRALAITWRRDELPAEHRHRAARLAAEKYESAAWTNAR
jgi:lipoate-protein ligase A